MLRIIQFTNNSIKRMDALEAKIKVATALRDVAKAMAGSEDPEVALAATAEEKLYDDRLADLSRADGEDAR